jgi:hypothetical protein
MSQLTLTPKEDQLVLDSVRARHAQYLSAYSVEDPDLVVLLDKIQNQIAPVVESAPVATPVAEPEVVVETTQAQDEHDQAQDEHE